jgi:hypothetical protein
MDDLLDLELRQEIEKISQDVKGIMKKVEELYPSPAGAQQSPKVSDDPAASENLGPNH